MGEVLWPHYPWWDYVATALGLLFAACCFADPSTLIEPPSDGQ
jgi:hypothetical protein